MNGPRWASDILELFYGLIELQQEPEEPQQMTSFCFFFSFLLFFQQGGPRKKMPFGK